jgi:hypothetical protein
MITLHTSTAAYYLHDDGMIYNAPESNAVHGDIDSAVLFDSLDTFLQFHAVVSIVSEDGYKFTVSADGVTNDDMSFESLQSAIEVLQS